MNNQTQTKNGTHTGIEGVIYLPPVAKSEKTQVQVAQAKTKIRIIERTNPAMMVMGTVISMIMFFYVVGVGIVSQESLTMVASNAVLLLLAICGFGVLSTFVGWLSWTAVTTVMKALDSVLGFAWRVIWFVPGTLLFWVTGIGGTKKPE